MLRDRLRGVKHSLEQRVRDRLERLSARAAQSRETDAAFGTVPEAALAATAKNRSTLETSPDDPPVVARLIVEIRSDGTRTIARGALKDELSGEQVSLLAHGTTPLALAAQLAKNLLTTPFAAGKLARAMRRAQLQEKAIDQESAADAFPSNDDAQPRRKR